MDVEIRELKRRLSELIEKAAHGETIRVTDRGKPKALLLPLTREDQLEAGISEGWIRGQQQRAAPRFSKGHPSDRSVAEVLAEDRGPGA